MHARIISKASDPDPEPKFLPPVVINQVLEDRIEGLSVKRVVWLGHGHALSNDLPDARFLWKVPL